MKASTTSNEDFKNLLVEKEILIRETKNEARVLVDEFIGMEGEDSLGECVGELRNELGRQDGIVERLRRS